MADPTTVRVRVTQEDIDAGVQGNCARCPVALAIARAVPGTEVVVGYATADISRGREHLSEVRLPYAVTLAIIDFDFGGFMSPFEFDLPLPTEPEVAASVEGDDE